MGEPKMPDYNSPEWQEEYAKARETEKQRKREQSSIDLVKHIEDMRTGKLFRKDTMEMLFGKSFEALNPDKPEQIPSVFSAEDREMVDSVLAETGLTEEEARSYVEKEDAKEYSDGIARLVAELRKGEMLNMSFGGVNAVDTFFDPNLEPVTLPWYPPAGDYLSPEKRREIIAKVLAETGLTEDEARRLLASKNQK